MLQKRGLGLVDQHECFTVATKLQQQFAQRPMSYNFYLTVIEGGYQLLLSNKGAVTLSNRVDLGVGQRGPYIAGKWASVPATLS